MAKSYIGRFAKTVELGIGLHLLGAKMSLNSSPKTGTTLECTDVGVVAISGKNGREILIPYANIRGAELMPEAPALKAVVKK